jgi:chromosome segregation ATPase
VGRVEQDSYILEVLRHWRWNEEIPMRKNALWLPLTILLWVPWTAAQAQPAAPASTSTLETEVADLDRSLQELVALLRELAGRQQTDLLLKRVELGYLKMGPLQQERKELRERKAADEEDLRRIQTVIAARQAAAETQETAKLEGPDEAVGKVMLEANIKRLKSRISEADQRIAELDSELQQEQRNVQRWEAMIDQRLDRR